MIPRAQKSNRKFIIEVEKKILHKKLRLNEKCPLLLRNFSIQIYIPLLQLRNRKRSYRCDTQILLFAVASETFLSSFSLSPLVPGHSRKKSNNDCSNACFYRLFRQFVTTLKAACRYLPYRDNPASL